MLDLRRLQYFAAVVEENNFGRAAERLHMTQPPLSRAIQRLEVEFGGPLLVRTAQGVTPTHMGRALYLEACELLARAESVNGRVQAAAVTTVRIGVLADGADLLDDDLVTMFRARHPEASVQVREGTFADPTVGLHAGQIDVAVTRAPFENGDLEVTTLTEDPVSVVLRADDPLAHRELLRLEDLAGRTWSGFPPGADPLWCAFWNPTGNAATRGRGPVVRTVRESHQATLWHGVAGLSPRRHALPAGLTMIPLADVPPSRLVVATRRRPVSPLVAEVVHCVREAAARQLAVR